MKTNENMGNESGRALFQEYELDAYLGDNASDFDIDAIIDEATEIDYSDGNRYWKDGIDLAEICAKHDIWRGEGWYRIGFSDGGQDWTNNGPLWVEFKSDLLDEMAAARRTETDTHLAWCEYMGSGDEPQKQGLEMETMKNIDILACFEEDGDDKRCGSRECLTALEAVMQEIYEHPADTADALEIGAMDENMNVSAFRIDDGWEVHIYIGNDDTWFTLE